MQRSSLPESKKRLPLLNAMERIRLMRSHGALFADDGAMVAVEASIGGLCCEDLLVAGAAPVARQRATDRIGRPSFSLKESMLRTSSPGLQESRHPLGRKLPQVEFGRCLLA